MLTFGTLELLALLTFLGGIVAIVIRHSITLGSMLKSIRELEKCRNVVENSKFMTHADHDGLQATCQTQVYKDMLRIETQFGKLEDRMDEAQRVRERDREADNLWKLSVQTALTEIKTLLIAKGDRRKHEQGNSED